MNTCARCETLPPEPPHSGTLYLAPPIAELRAGLLDYFRALGRETTEPHPGLLAVPFSGDDLERYCAECFLRLKRLELEDTRALVTACGEAACFAQLTRMQPLSRLVALLRGGRVLEALRHGRVTTHFQPIVHCRRPGRVHAYECLLRGLDPGGAVIPPGELFSVAREADLLFHLDRLARLTSIRLAKAKGVGPRVFINFSPAAIYNPEFCLRSTLEAVRECGMRPDSVVFEVVESDRVTDAEHLLRVLRFYRSAGFLVALDDLGAGFSSLNLLASLRPDYVKLDMDLVRGVDTDPYRASIIAHILSLARSLGVRCVVEGVETAGEWRWLAQAGADLVQGYLFARPEARPPRPAVPQADPG